MKDLLDRYLSAVARQLPDRQRTDIVAELRDEQPPATRFDPRKAGVRQTGNPHKKKDRP